MLGRLRREQAREQALARFAARICFLVERASDIERSRLSNEATFGTEHLIVSFGSEQAFVGSKAKSAFLVDDDAIEEARRDHSGPGVNMLPGGLSAELLQSLSEEAKPVHEMAAVEARYGDMLGHGAANELAAAEQNGSPEALHLAEVDRPVIDTFREDRPQQGISADALVEALHEVRNKAFVDANGFRFRPLGLTGD